MDNTKRKKVIIARNISKSYTKENKKISILENASIDFETGKFYAITGHSGSGKSTLINILCLIDFCDSGVIKINNLDVKELNDKKLSLLRMENIGFIFQDFQLDPYLKAFENVMLPMIINKNINKEHRTKCAIKLLQQFGLDDRINHYPREMSGGEQQRVAIARALANIPKIILADEPTGNLDKKTEKEVFSYLKKLANDGKCVIVVSHSDLVRQYADYVYTIDDGKIDEVYNDDN